METDIRSPQPQDARPYGRWRWRGWLPEAASCSWNMCVDVCVWSTRGSKIASVHAKLSNTTALDSDAESAYRTGTKLYISMHCNTDILYRISTPQKIIIIVFVLLCLSPLSLPPSVQSKDGKTPLHMAATHGRFSCSQALVQNGESHNSVLSA